MAYLDHNATSTLRPEVRAAMVHALDALGNPSSIHRAGRAARAIVEDGRENVARLVGARSEEVIFTSGGTEANVLALRGAVEGAAGAGAPIERIYISAIEHDSVLKTAAALEERYPAIRFATISVTKDGAVDIGALRRLLDEPGGRALVVVMVANNETGVVQPADEVVELVRNADALCLVDAVQACGKIALDFAQLGADYMTLSAHKIGGPQGSGALVAKEQAPFAAQLLGGGQERSRRAGTENLAGIAGFAAAAKASTQENAASLAALRDRFEAQLRRSFPDLVVFGEKMQRLDNTSNFAIPGIAAETAVIALDLDGVMVSSGAACSSGKVQSSRVLKAMGVPHDLARSALRVSLGWNSTQSDIDAALAALEKLSARVAARRAA